MNDSKNNSITQGLSMVNDGLLDYHKALIEKIKIISVAEAQTGRLETLMLFKDSLEGVIDSIHLLGKTVEGMEAIFMEHGVTTNDIS